MIDTVDMYIVHVHLEISPTFADKYYNEIPPPTLGLLNSAGNVARGQKENHGDI